MRRWRNNSARSRSISYSVHFLKLLRFLCTQLTKCSRSQALAFDSSTHKDNQQSNIYFPCLSINCIYTHTDSALSAAKRVPVKKLHACFTCLTTRAWRTYMHKIHLDKSARKPVCFGENLVCTWVEHSLRFTFNFTPVRISSHVYACIQKIINLLCSTESLLRSRAVLGRESEIMWLAINVELILDNLKHFVDTSQGNNSFVNC